MVYLVVAIKEMHRKVWQGVKTHKHILSKVYTINDEATDIIVLGKVQDTLDDGTSTELSFTVQAIFASTAGDTAKALHWQMWTVCLYSSPLKLDASIDLSFKGFSRSRQGVDIAPKTKNKTNRTDVLQSIQTLLD